MYKYLIFFMVLNGIFFSCKRNELVFSCDPEINSIVKSGQVEFSEIHLSEFLEYDISFQRAIYRSFTPEKMRLFWLEKLDSVIAINLYSPDEINHIENLKNKLVPELFIFNQEERDVLDGFYLFVNEWSEHASSYFNWSNTHINFILCTLYFSEEQYLNQMAIKSEVLDPPTGEDCNCASDADCAIVDPEFNCNQGGNCAQGLGCGPIWLSTCTGNCG